MGHRSTEWCPRCGTSISAHELVGNYEDRSDPSLFVRFPLARPAGRVASRLDDDAVDAAGERRRGRQPRGRVRAAAGRRVVGGRPGAGRGVRRARSAAPSSSAFATRGRSTTWRPPRGRAPGYPLGGRLARGGDRDRPHRARLRRRGLRARPRVHELPVLMPVDEAGRFYTGLRLAARARARGRPPSRSSSTWASAGSSSRAGEIEHRFPFCWRCHTPLIFRIADDWFIAVDELRPKLHRRQRDREVDARSTSASAWTTGSGTWATGTSPAGATSACRSRSTPAQCGHLTVVGSKAELARARHGRRSTGWRSCTGPGSTRSRSVARPAGTRACGASRRSGTSGSTPGSCPFSTLGWENAEWVESGYATGASDGLSGADLPDHAYWETWFPADWVSEMREQIRLWFYSQLFMSVALDRPCAVPRGARLREDARRARAARCTARGGT